MRFSFPLCEFRNLATFALQRIFPLRNLSKTGVILQHTGTKPLT
jgi:hypothetical protein